MYDLRLLAGVVYPVHQAFEKFHVLQVQSAVGAQVTEGVRGQLQALFDALCRSIGNANAGALEHMDQGFEDLKTRIEDLEKNPRTVVQAAEPGAAVQATPEEANVNVFQSDVDKIIDDAVRYVINEKEIDAIIGKYVEDLKINFTINDKKEGK